MPTKEEIESSLREISRRLDQQMELLLLYYRPGLKTYDSVMDIHKAIGQLRHAQQIIGEYYASQSSDT